MHGVFRSVWFLAIEELGGGGATATNFSGGGTAWRRNRERKKRESGRRRAFTGEGDVTASAASSRSRPRGRPHVHVREAVRRRPNGAQRWRGKQTVAWVTVHVYRSFFLPLFLLIPCRNLAISINKSCSSISDLQFSLGTNIKRLLVLKILSFENIYMETENWIQFQCLHNRFD